MADAIDRLFPRPGGEQPLSGTFLAHDLRSRGRPLRPYLYSNFIASLDGRVALPDRHSGLWGVPKAVANGRDWRLFMELAAQADVLLVSDKLLRAVAVGRHTALIDLEADGLEDLVEWRRRRGLVRQPVLAAVSRDLDLPAPDLAQRYTRDILVLTTDDAPGERVTALERGGLEVVRAGPGPYLGADRLIAAMAERGLGIIYSLAGPRMLHTLLAGNRLDRLYLTTALTAVGGDAFETLLRGPELRPEVAMHPVELYYDPVAPEGAGQLIQVLEPGQ